MSNRIRIMEYLYKNGLSTLDELSAGVNEPNRKRLIDNAKSAVHDGYIDRTRDDVTGQAAYQLTDKGRARVKMGGMSVNGKTAEENAAAEHVMSAPPSNDLQDMVDELLLTIKQKDETIKDLNQDIAGMAAFADVQANKISDLSSEPGYGYAVVVGDLTLHKCRDDAKEIAEQALREADAEEVHIVAVLNSAMMQVKWREA